MIEITDFRNYREIGGDFLLEKMKLAEVTVKTTTRKFLLFKKVEIRTKTIMGGILLGYWSFIGGKDEPIPQAEELERAYKEKESKMSELKPCPFCGSPAKASIDKDRCFHSVMCSEELDSTLGLKCPMNSVVTNKYENHENAASAWDTRVESSSSIDSLTDADIVHAALLTNHDVMGEIIYYSIQNECLKPTDKARAILREIGKILNARQG